MRKTCVREDPVIRDNPVSFDPIFSQESEILILGTFPSVISRNENFYYANPRNAFWPIMEVLCGADNGFSGVSEKKKALIDRKIALWDVCKTCKIRKSSDSSIKINEFNDVKTLFSQTKIKAVFFNGKKAEQLFKSYLKEKNITVSFSMETLPSTSPAYAISPEKKRDIWIEKISLYL